MQESARAKREERIASAAYDLLEEKGYSGTSMLAIARRARASNETLYNWYGDKLGLFRALVVRNAQDVKALLDASLDRHRDPLRTLEALGPMLLDLLLGNRAVALNRAAASDATGKLGAALTAAGRDVVLPLIMRVLEDGRKGGVLAFDDPSDAADLYLNLLVGDLQIRRVIGQIGAPGKAETAARAARALQRFMALSSQ